MDKPTTTPRRPLVPGPGINQGIAARAVALREAANQQHTPPAPLGTLPPPPTDQEAARAGREALRVGFGMPTPIGKIAGAIASVMSEIGSIPKTGYNKFHNYHYATLPDLLYVLTPLMGKHGIAVFQSEVEIKVIENRMAVTYDFTVAHSSNETWPERLRFTGMSIGRDSKGSWDDKAVNKCHSAARKYFLLALFQVPTGDFEDADAGPATSPQQSNPQERATKIQQPIIEERPRTVPGPATPSKQPITDERTPHKITLPPGSGADQWARKYIDALTSAENEQELAQWDELNGPTLQMLSEKFPDIYKQIDEVFTRLIIEIAPATAMPDPVNDAQEAMNWVASQLANTTSYEQAEKLWNTAIAPHEEQFDPADWELLMNEWRRAELRLNPEGDEPDPA